MFKMSPEQRGMTAVEVLVASMLSALLMVAVMGTMRGLKAHERALNLRDPTASWQRSLSHVLQQDLNNARSMRITPQYFELDAIASHQEGMTGDTWLPVVVRYELRQIEDASWLVRRETQGSTSIAQLACRGVTGLRVNQGASAMDIENATVRPREQAVVDGLTIEFLQADGQQVFGYEFRQL
jgi:prepilin-type N-terminal cleavage/methylation domain-containing protein